MLHRRARFGLLRLPVGQLLEQLHWVEPAASGHGSEAYRTPGSWSRRPVRAAPGRGSARSSVESAPVPDIEPQCLGPAPCDGCRLAERCKLRHEACAAFASYVAGESEKRWRAAKREPTHKLFAELLEYESRAARLARKLREQRPIGRPEKRAPSLAV